MVNRYTKAIEYHDELIRLYNNRRIVLIIVSGRWYSLISFSALSSSQKSTEFVPCRTKPILAYIFSFRDTMCLFNTIINYSRRRRKRWVVVYFWNVFFWKTILFDFVSEVFPKNKTIEVVENEANAFNVWFNFLSHR